MRTLPAALFAASLVLSSCSGTNEVDLGGAKYQAEMQLLEARIVYLIGDARCTDSTQCRAIAFGTKPCGGPWRYLVYSVASVDTLHLERLVRQYNAVNAAWNRSTGVASTCDIVGMPRVSSVDGRCVAVRD